jgi:hypothetical protein
MEKAAGINKAHSAKRAVKKELGLLGFVINKGLD